MDNVPAGNKEMKEKNTENKPVRDKKSEADIERRLTFAKEKKKELMSSSKILFDLCKDGKISYGSYIERTKEICGGYDYGESIYALDHEISKCNESLKEYRADPYIKNLVYASFMLVLVVAFGAIYMSTFTSNLGGFTVLDLQNGTLDINVNSFIPQERDFILEF